MTYRDDKICHICGAPTRTSCPRCENPVCSRHSLAAHLEDARGTEREQALRLARRLGGQDACQACLDQELARARGPWVEVLRLGDPIQLQVIHEALQQGEFDVRAIGTRDAALLGAGQHIFEQRIEVPEPQAGQAMELIHELLQELDRHPPPGADAEDAEDDEDDEDDTDHALAAYGDPGALAPAGGDDPAALPSPRRRGIAAGLSVIFPGGGHYYTGRPWTGLPLTLTALAGLVRLAAGATAPGVVLLLGAPLVDLVGAQLAISPANRGVRSPAWLQLLSGAAAAGLLWVAGVVVG